MDENQDLKRMEAEYNRRKIEIPANKYSTSNIAYAEMISRRSIGVLKLIKKAKINIRTAKLLEIGCGSGGVLGHFNEFGFLPGNMFGLDYFFPSLLTGKNNNPFLQILQADGQNIPFGNQKFEVLLQFTAFSSVLSDEVKKNMAKEMIRVLKNEGIIIWYDFIWNPINKNTKGINKDEIINLFPECDIEFKKITLAPPIMRVIHPFSKKISKFLENLSIFNSHYLVTIRKKQLN